MRHAKEYECFARGHATVLISAFVHVVGELCNYCSDNTTAGILRRFIFLISNDAVQFHVLQSGFDVSERQLMWGFVFDEKGRNVLVRAPIVNAKLVCSRTRSAWLCGSLPSRP
jgi:hypothetical protein